LEDVKLPEEEKPQMSNDDMIAAAIVSLAPALLGGLMGGKQGALAGGAAGAGAVGSALTKQAETDAKAAADKKNRQLELEEYEKKLGIKNRVAPDKPKTRAVTTRAPDGTETTKIVADEIGSEFKSAPKPKAGDEVPDGDEVAWKKLPKDQQITVQKLAQDNAQRTSIANMMKAELENYKNAKTEDDKIKAGQGMLKLLNSPLNPDAVGKEESERIGSFLEFKKGNFTGPGSFIGRDLDLFENQVADKIGAMDSSVAANQAIVDGLLKRQPKATEQTKASPKKAPTQKSGKPTTVVQGGHTYTLNEATGEYE
jgi:hypothetical protein